MARDSGHRERPPPKVLGQAGSAPGSGVGGAAPCGVMAKNCGEGAMGVSGDVSRGGVGAMGVQGGENPKGSWVQVLLSPAPNSAGVACQTIPGKVTSREEEVYAVGVSEFNAKVELYNCREWLKRIRVRWMQGYLGNECVPKPKRVHEPRGKKIFIPKALSVGPGIGPSGCKTFLKHTRLTSSAGGSSGPFNGPQGGPGIGPSGSKNPLKPTSLTTSAGGPSGPFNGPYARDKPTECGLGSPVGRTGHFEGDPSKEEGPIGCVVGRPDSCDLISDGSAARASPLRSGESGSGSSMEKEGSHEVAESIEPLSKEGVTGSVKLKPMQVGKEGSSPAKERKDLCAKTPVSSRVEQRGTVSEPLALLPPLVPCPAAIDYSPVPPVVPCNNGTANAVLLLMTPLSEEDNEEIIKSVVSGSTPSYSLEAKLRDYRRVAAIRREAMQRIFGRTLEGQPLEGFDYDSIHGAHGHHGGLPCGQHQQGLQGHLLLWWGRIHLAQGWDDQSSHCQVRFRQQSRPAQVLLGGSFSFLFFEIHQYF
ncbi:hypothetical protein FH972_012275 [Carpinus fangiana]|uniref:Uncharacterized protein n=1 Tax=Carpinus fangiana TaxID=176857 RepID=A0A5N6R5N5_9ROSI|nr:hypothetical protein FH972_012275 [Carpinus fangiana]